MATIAHLSDVHFGAHEPKIVDAAEAWLLEHRPDLLVISGDFTQRARIAQFKLASAWLNKLRADGFNIISDGIPLGAIQVPGTGKPIILSTGMSTIEQIDTAVETLGTSNLILLHSTSTYPLPPEEANLRTIATLTGEKPAEART